MLFSFLGVVFGARVGLEVDWGVWRNAIAFGTFVMILKLGLFGLSDRTVLVVIELLARNRSVCAK